MKSAPLMSCLLVASLAIATPTVVIAHVGHGDEFQAQGGVNRVKVSAETDSLMGIQVTPIAAAGTGGVMIPVTALVDDSGKKLVFVQYDNFYEPVPVTTGATKGEMIEITKGLSAGEKLVTQGSLSLYAESRKTQGGETAAKPSGSPAASTAASPAASAAATQAGNLTHAQADAQGIPHSHDHAGGMVHGSPLKALAVVGGGLAVLGGAVAFFVTQKKRGGSN
jgi:membrane fusion protein, cation efflux system